MLISRNFDVVFALAEHQRVREIIAECRNRSCVAIDCLLPHRRLAEMQLGDEAQLVLRSQNAGGNSELSEALSVEYLCAVFGARRVTPEMQVQYWIQYKIVDYLTYVHGKRIGVSVTRAMGYPSADCFTLADAQRLLHKKLYGLIVARASTCSSDGFYNSLLHIWCQDRRIAELVREAWGSAELELRDHIVVLCTVTALPCIWHNRQKRKRRTP